MDTQPKTAADGLRRVKTNVSHQRIGPRQQQKFRNTLEQWLIKPRKNPHTAEVCQIQDDVEITDDSGAQSSSAQSLDCQNAGKTSVSDTDEETQPLTPQNLEGDNPISPSSEDSADSGLMQTLSGNDGGLEKQEMETSSARSEGSVKHNTKITDFFSGTSVPCPPVRRGRTDKFPEKQDADEESSSSNDKPEVKWLGTPISELKRMPECGGLLPPLKDVPGQHTVMIRV